MSDWEEIVWEEQPYDVIMRLAAEERSRTPKLDWLRSRPDKRLQTPEGQRFLDDLFGVIDPDPKVDALAPWLAREWKKGRIVGQGHPDMAGQDFLGRITPEGRLSPIGYQLPHWADWFHSNHPTRRGVDIMQLNAHDMHSKINEWDRQMQEEAENASQKNAEGGEVVHSWPDGWTIRRLGPEHLKYEGDNMGHCVGDYGYEDQVRNGETAIYSLRGPDHRPHATMELEPQYYELNDQGKKLDLPTAGPMSSAHTEYYDSDKPLPHKGQIVQIQGKGNEVPKPEYQQRIKDWFSTIPEDQRPQWQNGASSVDHIVHLDPEAPYTDARREGLQFWDQDMGGMGGYGEHGDYGLPDNRGVDWGRLLDSLPRYRTHGDEYIGRPSYDPKEGQLVYDYARKRGQVPDFAKALQRFDEEQNDDFHEQYEEHARYYPEEYPPYDPDEWPDNPELETRYNEAQEEYAKEHAGSQASSHLFTLLNPHWNNETQQYENEPQKQPQTFT